MYMYYCMLFSVRTLGNSLGMLLWSIPRDGDETARWCRPSRAWWWIRQNTEEITFKLTCWWLDIQAYCIAYCRYYSWYTNV